MKVHHQRQSRFSSDYTMKIEMDEDCDNDDDDVNNDEEEDQHKWVVNKERYSETDNQGYFLPNRALSVNE